MSSEFSRAGSGAEYDSANEEDEQVDMEEAGDAAENEMNEFDYVNKVRGISGDDRYKSNKNDLDGIRRKQTNLTRVKHKRKQTNSSVNRA